MLYSFFLFRFSFSSLRENSPRDPLWKGRLCELPAPRLLHLHPAVAFAIEIPAAATFAGHIESQERACLPRAIAVRERQRAHEAVEHRIVKVARHDPRPVGGEPDLLLVMPPFRQLPSRVEPVHRPLFTGPCDAEDCLRHWIERLVELR